eukprot:TRINITY_DN18192_c0_g1_i1.p1 TRINITY_DN18192_c0_g1~~TRINITY_DN18192_c0_g1_i1.p1  ORF type:complete len:288 (-),score=15.50 TRINITY_DN18192_c0_g1_i1:25-786(-)
MRRLKGELSKFLLPTMWVWQYYSWHCCILCYNDIEHAFLPSLLGEQNVWDCADGANYARKFPSSVPLQCFYHVLLVLQIWSYVQARSTSSMTKPSDGSSATRMVNCTLCCDSPKAGVIGMDHHCVFINNCVGMNNRKAFCLGLLYTILVTATLCLCSCSAFLFITSNSVWTHNDCNLLLGTIVTFWMHWGSVFLLGMQIASGGSGKTTVELLTMFFDGENEDWTWNGSSVCARLGFQAPATASQWARVGMPLS